MTLSWTQKLLIEFKLQKKNHYENGPTVQHTDGWGLFSVSVDILGQTDIQMQCWFLPELATGPKYSDDVFRDDFVYAPNQWETSYIVTPSLIGSVYTQNDPCILDNGRNL